MLPDSIELKSVAIAFVLLGKERGMRQNANVIHGKKDENNAGKRRGTVCSSLKIVVLYRGSVDGGTTRKPMTRKKKSDEEVQKKRRIRSSPTLLL